MKKNIFNLLLMLTMIITSWSCSDLLEVEPGEVVTYENRYLTPEDARTALLGVYAQAHEIASQYVILGELRGDLIDVTSNADDYLREINEHRIDASRPNPYINISTFYKVINNCNDVMVNLKVMANKNLLSLIQFNTYYPSVVTLRNWLYLNLVIQYGKVPYINIPITSANPDVVFPLLNIDQMVDSLLVSMSQVSTFGNFSGTKVGDIDLSYQFIDPYVLIGDLYLWSGKYYNAAMFYKLGIMDNLSTNKYKLTITSGVNAPVNSSITNSWGNFFSGGSSNTDEIISMFSFSNKYGMNNSFQLLFGDEDEHGKYMLRPSTLSINNWEAEGDLYRAMDKSYDVENGDTIVFKYLDRSWNNESDVYIYRAGTTYLRYCEAVNRLGKPQLALDILNFGPGKKYGKETNSIFKFDTIQYISCLGVRGRVNLAKDTLIVGAATTLDSILQVEKKIFKELAVEAAFEGLRWPDYVRFARRYKYEDNNESYAKGFISEGISKKFTVSNSPAAEAVRNKLFSSEDNWYLPLPEIKDIKVQ